MFGRVMLAMSSVFVASRFMPSFSPAFPLIESSDPDRDLDLKAKHHLHLPLSEALIKSTVIIEETFKKMGYQGKVYVRFVGDAGPLTLKATATQHNIYDAVTIDVSGEGSDIRLHALAGREAAHIVRHHYVASEATLFGAYALTSMLPLIFKSAGNLKMMPVAVAVSLIAYQAMINEAELDADKIAAKRLGVGDVLVGILNETPQPSDLIKTRIKALGLYQPTLFTDPKEAEPLNTKVNDWSIKFKN